MQEPREKEAMNNFEMLLFYQRAGSYGETQPVFLFFSSFPLYAQKKWSHQ